MPAILTKGALNTAPVNSYAVDTTYYITAPGRHSSPVSVIIEYPGRHHQYNEFSIKATGRGNITIIPLAIKALGQRRMLETMSIGAPGRFDLALFAAVITAPGKAKRWRTYNPQVIGSSVLRRLYATNAPGAHHVLEPLTILAPGVAQYGYAHVMEVWGRHAVAQPTHTRVYRQGYRVANDDIATLELYAGYDAMPDFDDVAQPVATGDPIAWTPTYPGAGLTTCLHLVVRKRNQYNLLAHNQHPILLEIDENGVEVLGPLTAPELVRVLDGSAIGLVQSWSQYLSENDRTPADIWELYAEIGVDPVVGVDSPVDTASIGNAFSGLAPWRGVASGLITGSTYHFRVVVRRAADDAYAQSGVVQLSVAPVFEIDAGSLSVFAGSEHEVKQ